MKIRALTIILVSAVISIAACSPIGMETKPPLEVVPHVDLERYTGVWYEIARYPHHFQEGCVGSRATYSLRKDGKLSVLNECFEGSFGGRLRSARGRAWVVDTQTNAKLKVSFFWPFSGDYWIIGLGDEYEYAVVGHPAREYLWILSRTKSMDAATYEGILHRLGEQGYDTTRLIKTPQDSEG